MDNLAAVYQPCSVLFIVHESAKKALPSTPKKSNFLTVKGIFIPFGTIYYLSACPRYGQLFHAVNPLTTIKTYTKC